MSKILYIDTHTAFGGSDTMLLRLLDGLDKNRFFPTVVCSEDNQRLIEELKKRSIRFVPLKTKNLILENKVLKALLQFPNFLRMNFKIAHIVKQEKPDVVQANLFYSALFSIIAAKFYRKPFIWIAQTLSDLQKYRFFVRFLVSFSGRTIVTCKDLIRVARESGFNTSKFQTIYTGLNMDEYQQEENSSAVMQINNKEVKKPIIVTIGRLDRYQKGHEYFIEAAKIIKGHIPEVNFLIVGGIFSQEEEQFKQELEKKIGELGLSNQIIFTGFYPDLIHLLSNIEIVIIPSLYEAPSAVALEAMAMRRPVVASDVGGIPEVVIDGQTGFLVPAKDPQAIADKAVFLLKNPEKGKQMGEEGFQRVKKNFTQEKLAKEYERLYEELTKRYENRN